MEELLSRNGLPIRRGVILLPGHDSEWAPPWDYHHVVRQREGGFDVLDQHNNVGWMTNEEAQAHFIPDGYNCREDWNCSNPDDGTEFIVDAEMCNMSGICAGVEDRRFPD